MIGKVLVSQVFGIAAGYVAYELCQEVAGNTPAYVPIAAWLFVTLFVLAKL